MTESSPDIRPIPFRTLKRDSALIVRDLIEAEQINKSWKLCHVFLLVLVAIFGISGGVVLSLLFQENVLCGMPSFVGDSVNTTNKPTIFMNGSFLILDIITSGKNDNACDFTQYTLVCSFIFATIWLAFFLMCGRGGKSSVGLPHPWRIVFPALVFTAIFTLIALGASIQITMATNMFCGKFDTDYAIIIKEKKSLVKCQELDRFLPTHDHFNMKIQDMILLGESLSWLTMIAWGASAGLCLLRMLMGPDFRPVLAPVQEERVSASSTGYRRHVGIV